MPYFVFIKVWRAFQSYILVKAESWCVVTDTVSVKTFSLFSNDILHYKHFLMYCSAVLIAAIIKPTSDIYGPLNKTNMILSWSTELCSSIQYGEFVASFLLQVCRSYFPVFQVIGIRAIKKNLNHLLKHVQFDLRKVRCKFLLALIIFFCFPSVIALVLCMNSSL